MLSSPAAQLRLIQGRNVCMPPACVAAMGYACIEPHVRRLVRKLREALFYPVWSCAGHSGGHKSPLWLEASVLAKLQGVGVKWWQRPRVICEGQLSELHETRLAQLNKVAQACGWPLLASIKITDPGCSLGRALPIPSRASDAHWFMVVLLTAKQFKVAKQFVGPRNLL